MPSPINIGRIDYKVMRFVPLSYPLTVSDLAQKPFSACETPMLLYPSERLTVEDYWACVDSSFWLRAEHDFFYLALSI